MSAGRASAQSLGGQEAGADGEGPRQIRETPAGGPCMASGLRSSCVKGKQHLATGQQLPKQSQLYQETSAAVSGALG